MTLAKKITTAAALAAALLAGTAPKAAAQCPYTVGPLGRYIAPAIVQGMTATDDGAAAQCAPDPCRAPVAAAQFQPQTFQRHGCSRSRSRSSSRRRTHKRQGGPCGLSCLLRLSDLVLFAVAGVICCGRLEAVAGHSFPRGVYDIPRHAFPGVGGGGVQILFNFFWDSN